MNELLAVVIAVAGAITFGASDVIEQRATHKVAKRPPLDLKLFADLAANRLWVIGITVDIAGSVMQAFALHFGPLALVQPILVLDPLFAVRRPRTGRLSGKMNLPPVSMLGLGLGVVLRGAEGSEVH